MKTDDNGPTPAPQTSGTPSAPMSVVDAMFLTVEAERRPTSIGAVALLDPPEGGDATQIGQMFAEALARNQVGALWQRQPRRSLTSLGQWYWHTEATVDLAYHVQLHTLPEHAGLSELWELVSQLHSGTLDRGRPLWQLHLIEGLVDGRYALYIKLHHALTDGVSALRLLQRSFSTDSQRRGMPALWEPHTVQPTGERLEPPDPPVGPLPIVRTLVKLGRQAVGVGPALADTVWRALRGRTGPLTLAAPHTPFTAPISGARCFGGCDFPLERLRLAAKRTGATINDVVLTMCAGALRRYLLDRDALPTAPLVAMVPVSLRRDEPDGTADTVPGNKIATLMCSLATDLADPVERLARIHTSMVQGKGALADRDQLPTLASSALGAAPLALAMLGVTIGPLRPPNVMISTLPGVPAPLYWNGARLDALYPLSVPVDGQSLNITCTSVNGQIMFGLTGCRRTVPAINTLVDYLAHELDLLDSVHQISTASRNRRRQWRATARCGPGSGG